MTGQHHFESADAERAKVRVAVATVGDLIARLPNAHSGPDRGLPEAWAELVKLLALGPARQLRDCPHCGHVAMSEATLCLHCWARLTPAPEASDGRQAAGGADS
jgi:hypothetical protein